MKWRDMITWWDLQRGLISILAALVLLLIALTIAWGDPMTWSGKDWGSAVSMWFMVVLFFSMGPERWINRWRRSAWLKANSRRFEIALEQLVDRASATAEFAFDLPVGSISRLRGLDYKGWQRELEDTWKPRVGMREGMGDEHIRLFVAERRWNSADGRRLLSPLDLYEVELSGITGIYRRLSRGARLLNAACTDWLRLIQHVDGELAKGGISENSPKMLSAHLYYTGVSCLEIQGAYADILRDWGRLK